LQEKPDYQLILWTVREGSLLKEAVEYCRDRGLEFYAVNSNYPEESKDNSEPRKLQADIFIDDRNLGGLPDWGVIYRMIRSGKHFDPITNEIQSEYQLPKKSFLKSIFGG